MKQQKPAVMELINNCSVNFELRSTAPLPIEEAQGLVDQIQRLGGVALLATVDSKWAYVEIR